MERTPEYGYCSRHHFTLRVAVARVLCSEYRGPLPDGYPWPVEAPDLNALASDTLYVWLEISSVSPDGVYAHEFNLRPFVSIEECKVWGEGEERDKFRRLHAEQRALYRQRGYDVK